MNASIEQCVLCGDPTGKAGPAEDSLFRDSDSVGPLCEECYCNDYDENDIQGSGIGPARAKR